MMSIVIIIIMMIIIIIIIIIIIFHNDNNISFLKLQELMWFLHAEGLLKRLLRCYEDELLTILFNNNNNNNNNNKNNNNNNNNNKNNNKNNNNNNFEHLSFKIRLPMALIELAKLEAASSSIPYHPKTPHVVSLVEEEDKCLDLLRQAVRVAKELYKNRLVYPHLELGEYFLRKSRGSEAFRSWADAADIISL